MSNEYKIVLKNEVYDKIFTLMENINKLNKGEEIGGWLTGDWDIENKTLLLDNFVIPKQEVSKVEVDISPESMMDTVKELGFEESNRIKAHWHIHPFGKGKTEWSSIDEVKIADFTDPTKGREVFVFLLSSEDWIKGRVVVVTKGHNETMKEDFYFTESFDNLEVTREEEVVNEYLQPLTERIKDKVSSIKSTYNAKEKAVEVSGSYTEPYDIKEVGKYITIRTTPEFGDFIQTNVYTPQELLDFTTVTEFKDSTLFTFDYNNVLDASNDYYRIEELIRDASYEYEAFIYKAEE